MRRNTNSRVALAVLLIASSLTVKVSCSASQDTFLDDEDHTGGSGDGRGGGGGGGGGRGGNSHPSDSYGGYYGRQDPYNTYNSHHDPYNNDNNNRLPDNSYHAAYDDEDYLGSGDYENYDDYDDNYDDYDTIDDPITTTTTSSSTTSTTTSTTTTTTTTPAPTTTTTSSTTTTTTTTPRPVHTDILEENGIYATEDEEEDHHGYPHEGGIYDTTHPYNSSSVDTGRGPHEDEHYDDYYDEDYEDEYYDSNYDDEDYGGEGSGAPLHPGGHEEEDIIVDGGARPPYHVPDHTHGGFDFEEERKHHTPYDGRPEPPREVEVELQEEEVLLVDTSAPGHDREGSPSAGGGVQEGAAAGGNMDGSVQIVTHKEDDRQVSIFAQPGMLAAFIGGAVVGLLCAILLVMFVVYRMRKKDEGSYPLDEPKRLPLTSSYATTDKEIYA